MSFRLMALSILVDCLNHSDKNRWHSILNSVRMFHLVLSNETNTRQLLAFILLVEGTLKRGSVPLRGKEEEDKVLCRDPALHSAGLARSHCSEKR